MNPNEPVAVYSVSDPFRAELIKNALEAEGIECFLEGDLQAAMPGISAVPIRVLVSAEQADQARKVIEEHEVHPNE